MIPKAKKKKKKAPSSHGDITWNIIKGYNRKTVSVVLSPPSPPPCPHSHTHTQNGYLENKHFIKNSLSSIHSVHVFE